MRTKISLFLVLSLVNLKSFCEIFSSVDELKTLARNEKKILDRLFDFKREANITSFYLDSKLKSWQEEHLQVMKNIEKYISNPLNAFLLIKRTFVDIELISHFLLIDFAEMKLKLGDLIPEEKDFSGAVEGLFRLQIIYDLKCEDFAEGIIEGVKTRNRLTPHDLYVIGKEATKIRGYEYFVFEYFKIALGLISQNVDQYGEVNLGDISISLAESFYKAGDNNGALLTIKALLNKTSDNLTAFKLKEKYQRALEMHGSQEASFNDPFNYEFKKDGFYSREKEQKIFSKACRGLFVRKKRELSNLYCRYVSKSAYSKIGPFKMEEFNLSPYLIMFYDVLSNHEIKQIKELSKPYLTRGKIARDNTEAVEKVRVVKTAFIGDNMNGTIERISRRVQDMTGLEIKTSESLQVQNYGIGGHFHPHWDNKLKREIPFNLGTGNRLGTVLFYMSNVEKGGHTVFPYIKVLVPPVKGAAVFWYSLKSSGDCEFYMKHGSCPVLIGNKWVANKWIHEYGQEFRSPCSPEKYEEFTEDDFHDIFF